MHKLFILLLIVSLTSGFLHSQEKHHKILKGKVIADYLDIEGVYIINLSTEQRTVTERGGYFKILVKPTDTLMFSSIALKGITRTIKEEDFNEELYFVKMEVRVNYLDEVIVRKFTNINAESLGIVPRGQRRYTSGERKLKTASGYDTQTGTNTQFSIDPLLNMLSGRTKMLKKALEAEKKENILKQIDELYEEEYYCNTLKIPIDYIKGFQYYIVEDIKFIQAVKAKNKTIARFLIGELAIEYNKLDNYEKE